METDVILFSILGIVGLISAIYGFEKFKASFYFGGAVVFITCVFVVAANLYCNSSQYIYLDDYNHGLFECDNVLYFKEAKEGRIFNVKTGIERVIDGDKQIKIIEK